VAKRLRAGAVVGEDGDIRLEKEKEKSVDEETKEVP